VGFISESDTESTEEFLTVAKALRNDYDFALVTDAGIASEQGVTTQPGLASFRKFDDPKVIYTGEFNIDDLADFIDENAFPLVGLIGPENYQKYVERALPLVWVFVDYSSDDQKAILPEISKVAKDFRSLSFVQLDGIKWADHSKSFGLSGTPPGVVIEDREHRKNYVFAPDKTVSEATVRAWVQAFADGTLSPTVRSEPIPESNDKPVKVVVGKTFDSIVLDDSKDVFLEFYAPWCGHCKALAPKFDKLGEMFADHPTVVIAKIDGTENDTPVEIRGFPTMMFFRAKHKSDPLQYDGDRTEEAMAKYIRENGSTTGGSGGGKGGSHDKDEL